MEIIHPCAKPEFYCVIIGGVKILADNPIKRFAMLNFLLYFTLQIPEIRIIIVSRAKSKVRTDGLLITMKLTLSVQGEVGDYKCANNFNTFVRRSKVLRRILHIFCFLQIVTRQ